MDPEEFSFGVERYLHKQKSIDTVAECFVEELGVRDLEVRIYRMWDEPLSYGRESGSKMGWREHTWEGRIEIRIPE